MGKFFISESERREILALHESYKKSLLQEQESDIPTSLPQNDIELTKFAESMKAEVYAGMVYERIGGRFEMYDVLSEEQK